MPGSNKRAWPAGILALALLAASPAMAAGDADSLVDRAGHQVSSFLDQVSDVKCTERVQQSKLNQNGRAEYVENSSFDYLILLQASNDDLSLNESRLETETGRHAKKNLPLLITNGFSTLFLIFHPYYRGSFHFELGPEEVVEGQHLARVSFRSIPGRRTPVGLGVRGREYPLELAGTAWLEPDTGMVTRIQATLANDLQDVGLRSLNADVEYSLISLPGWKQAYRFPSTATIEVETLRQRWRNVHRFSDYKRFLVDTENSVTQRPDLK